jgi:hypothetical protein
MCEVTESESLERRLESLQAENEQLRALVDGLKALDAERKLFLGETLAFVELLKAEAGRLRGRAELAERERDRLAEVARAYNRWEADLILSDEAWRGGMAELPTLTYPLYDRMMEIQAMRNEALSDLDAETAGGVMVRTPEQYELGYAVAVGFTVQGVPVARRESYRLIRRLPDGNYLVEDPAATGPGGERTGDESH